MKVYQSLLVLLLVAGCGQNQREREFNTSVEALKNLQKLQKLKSEMVIGELEAKNNNLRTEVASLESQVASLESQVASLQSKNGGHAEGHGETNSVETEEDNPKKPEPIVPEGESIVINPAGSGGTRYLLVEIFLLRKDEKDIYFPKAISVNSKQLQAATVDWLSAENAQSLADPATKQKFKAAMKESYQETLGSKHPIDKVIVAKWIMQ